MNKTKSMESIKSTLQAFQNQAAAIRKERESVNDNIGKLKAEIKRLQDMPVSKSDFSMLLKEHIAAQAARSEENLVSALTETKKSWNSEEIEKDSYNKRGFSSLEVRQIGSPILNNVRPGWIFDCFNVAHAYNDFLAPEQLSDGDKTLTLLCYLLPDIIHDRIMKTIESKIGTAWGNEELPSVSSRRETIIDIQIEIKDLQARLAELDAAINEFNSAATLPTVKVDEHAKLIAANYQQ